MNDRTDIGGTLAAIDATLDVPAHDALLQALDHAYSDGTVSALAMRWTPVRPVEVRADTPDPYRDPFPHVLVPRGPARSLDELRMRAVTGTLTEQDMATIRALTRAMQDAARPLCAAFTQAVRGMVEAFRPFRDAMVRAQRQTRRDFLLVPPQPRDRGTADAGDPAQVMLRALEARRARSTGPAPDRLDGRRTRR